MTNAESACTLTNNIYLLTNDSPVIIMSLLPCKWLGILSQHCWGKRGHLKSKYIRRAWSPVPSGDARSGLAHSGYNRTYTVDMKYGSYCMWDLLQYPVHQPAVVRKVYNSYLQLFIYHWRQTDSYSHTHTYSTYCPCMLLYRSKSCFHQAALKCAICYRTVSDIHNWQDTCRTTWKNSVPLFVKREGFGKE